MIRTSRPRKAIGSGNLALVQRVTDERRSIPWGLMRRIGGMCACERWIGCRSAGRGGLMETRSFTQGDWVRASCSLGQSHGLCRDGVRALGFGMRGIGYRKRLSHRGGRTKEQGQESQLKQSKQQSPSPGRAVVLACTPRLPLSTAPAPSANRWTWLLQGRRHAAPRTSWHCCPAPTRGRAAGVATHRDQASRRAGRSASLRSGRFCASALKRDSAGWLRRSCPAQAYRWRAR